MKSYLIEDLFIRNNEKIKMYKTEEQNDLQKIKELLESINNNYNTSNTEKLNNVIFELKIKFNTIQNIHNNNLYVFNKTIKKYKLTTNENIKMYNKK